MMLSVMAYGFMVALLVGLAALGAERALAMRNLPRRGVWIASLIASLAFPAFGIFTPDTDPQVVADTPRPVASTTKSETRSANAAPSQPAVRQATASLPVHRTSSFRAVDIGWIRWPGLDRVLMFVWVAGSAGVLGLYCAAWIRIRRAAKHWPQTEVDGGSVRVTDGVGPAVIGYLKPEIVVPRWLVQASPDVRAMVLAHERAHIAVRDPLMLLIALLLTAIMPWNPAMWWQLRRLRFAIEVDCDARVLRRGADAWAYGDVLLTVTQQRSLAFMGGMPIAAPASQLERRIRIMTSLQPQGSRWLIGIAAGLSFACVAVATQLQAPELGEDPLIKPPFRDWSPFLPMAEDAAQAAYPELFEGHFNGTVVLLVDLDRSGVVLNIERLQFPPGPPTHGAHDAYWRVIAHDAWRGRGSHGYKFVGWFGPERTNGLYIAYRLLKWPVDPTRSLARVEAAVMSHYPEFYRTYLPTTSEPSEGKHLTLLMNDDGTIGRAKLIDIPIDYYPNESEIIEHFRELGLPVEQLSHRGHTTNWEYGLFEIPRMHASAPFLRIDYAWPRRSEDPPDVSLQSHPTEYSFDLRKLEEQSHPRDEEFVMRYFPVAWREGSGSGHLWILLDQLGNVVETGRASENPIGGEFEAELAARGIRIGGASSTRVDTEDGEDVSLTYLWVSADSDLASLAGLSK